MKLCKYYSLDECANTDEIYSILEQLQEDGKIEFEIVDTDTIKLKDTGLSQKGTKELISTFNEYDVIEYPDYEDMYESDDEDEEEEDDDDYDMYDDDDI